MSASASGTGGCKAGPATDLVSRTSMEVAPREKAAASRPGAFSSIMTAGRVSSAQLPVRGCRASCRRPHMPCSCRCNGTLLYSHATANEPHCLAASPAGCWCHHHHHTHTHTHTYIHIHIHTHTTTLLSSFLLCQRAARPAPYPCALARAGTACFFWGAFAINSVSSTTPWRELQGQ